MLIVLLVFAVCNLTAGLNQYTFYLGGELMSCAPGTIFNLTACTCSVDPDPSSSVAGNIISVMVVCLYFLCLDLQQR